MTRVYFLEATLLLIFSASGVAPAYGFVTAPTSKHEDLVNLNAAASPVLGNNDATALPLKPKPKKSIPFSEMTKNILDERADNLSEDLNDSILPLLVWWGKKESTIGAKTIESLLEQLETQNNGFLSNRHYTVAVDAWGKAPVDDSTEHAERMLELMKIKDLNPTRVTYNALMNAYSRKGKAEDVEKILSFMEETDGIEPITNDYNVLLSTYARLGQGRKAEAALKRMIHRFIESGCSSEPDLYSYNMLLDAWSKSSENGRGERAEGILKALESKYESGEFRYRPDVRTYSAAICAVVRSKEKASIQRAEELLSRAEKNDIVPDVYLYSTLLDAYATGQTPGSAGRAEELLDRLEKGGVANAVTYNTVLKALKSSRDLDAATRAEAILSSMEEKNLADTISYSTIISLYANKGGHAAATRAEEIMKHMKNEGTLPNCQTVNSVINAWIRSGELRRAERILEEMERCFYQGKSDIVPNVVSYTTLMNGWAKSNSANGTAKTKEWFQRMNSMYHSGNKEARPNAFSYVTLISTIGKSDAPGAASEAEEVLLEMFKEFQKGNKEAKPNTQIAAIVIDAWQRSGERNAGERAEAVLNLLVDRYMEPDRDETLRPNEFTFASAISAWARSRKFGKAVRARAILTKMSKMFESGQIKAHPNAHCYTGVINSCAFAENDAVEKREALQIAVETYKELCASEYARPNAITFSTMITALRNLLPASEKRSAALATIFEKCIEDGQVSDLVLRRLQAATSAEQFTTLVGENVVSQDGKINLEQIPHAWKCNVA